MTALIIGLIVVIYFAWLRHEVKIAPWGHEDADGFHYDEPQDAPLGVSNAPKR